MGSDIVCVCTWNADAAEEDEKEQEVWATVPTRTEREATFLGHHGQCFLHEVLCVARVLREQERKRLSSWTERQKPKRSA